MIQDKDMMSFEQQVKTYRVLNQWFQTPQGEWVAQAFIEVLLPYQKYLKGERLLQLGLCGSNPWLKRLNFPHPCIASPFAYTNQSIIQQVVSNAQQLPFEKDSFDCIVAPLTAETLGAQAALHEIDRVLKPRGYVIFLGMNPISLWGGALKLGLLSPWKRSDLSLRTSFSLNHAFTLMGYKQYGLHNFAYIPPVRTAAWMKRLHFMNDMGKMLWPCPSGFYCYIAQKQEPGFLGPLKVAHQKAPLIKYKTQLRPVPG